MNPKGPQPSLIPWPKTDYRINVRWMAAVKPSRASADLA
jgi:hypothetical protein